MSKKGPKSEAKPRLPIWFFPVLDKIFWPVLGVLIAVVLYMASLSLLGL